MSEPDQIQDEPRERVLSNAQVVGFIARRWMRRPGQFATAAGLMLAAVGFDLAAPWAAGALVDAVATGAEAAAWRAWGVFVGLYLAFMIARNIAFRVWNPFAARNMEEMTVEAFERVQSFSADWHANAFAGATVRKVSRAMWGYDSVSDQLILWLGSAMLVVAGLCVAMLVRWPMVGVFASVMAATYVAMTLALSTRYVRPLNLISNARDSGIGAALADAVTGAEAVRAFGAETRERTRFAGVVADWRRAAVRTWTRWTNAWAVQNLILVGLQAGLTGLVLRLWTQGEATPGDVAFAISAFLLMSGYLRSMGENVQMIQKGIDDVEDVAAYLRTPAQVGDRAGAPDFVPGRGEIVFDRVDFGYRNQAARLYDGLSLRIAPGERVALVGATGAGKTTFVKLIQRLYDLDGGQIRIDDQDVAAVRQASLRRAIAVVPQDPALFHRTIGENIAYARPEAGRAAIEAAAKAARAHDFILRLPQGYDTLVGERGVKLSGGERQRVAIARALMADAPILVLDEATASLDVETERLVQQATEALMHHRTTLIIAHRLSTVRRADRVLVFEGGRIVEDGAPADLLAQDGVYARLSAAAAS